MSAITVRPTPTVGAKIKAGAPAGPSDYMPFSIRLKVAGEINKLWEEFVTEMYDGPFDSREVADKFWKFVTR